MKTVQLSQVPDGNFTITKMRDRAIITLYDNVQEIPDKEELTYTADQYQLKTVWREGLKIDYKEWLNLAKKLENPQTDAEKRMARDMAM